MINYVDYEIGISNVMYKLQVPDFLSSNDAAIYALKRVMDDKDLAEKPTREAVFIDPNPPSDELGLILHNAKRARAFAYQENHGVVRSHLDAIVQDLTKFMEVSE